MIRRIRYFIRATAGSLWQFRTRNFFSVAIICLSFLTLGVFLSVANNLRQAARVLADNMTVTFFIGAEAGKSDIDEIERRIRTFDLVEEVQFVPAALALERFRETFPELRDIVESLDVNPFPPSFDVRIRGEASQPWGFRGFVDEIRMHKDVEDVQFNQDLVDKMQSLGRVAQAIGFFLGGILVLASFFIISNVIKLNVFARRNEIEILRLVGATNTFIRIPFLLEGLVLGISGSLLALALLLLTIKLFPLYIGSSVGALQDILNLRFLMFSQAAGLIAAGATIGLLGSGTSLSRFLKV